jgi:hypothetical protein
MEVENEGVQSQIWAVVPFMMTINAGMLRVIAMYTKYCA